MSPVTEGRDSRQAVALLSSFHTDAGCPLEDQNYQDNFQKSASYNLFLFPTKLLPDRSPSNHRYNARRRENAQQKRRENKLPFVEFSTIIKNDRHNIEIIYCFKNNLRLFVLIFHSKFSRGDEKKREIYAAHGIIDARLGNLIIS